MHVIRSKVCCLIPFCLQFFSLFIFFLVGSSWSVAFSPEVLSTIAICSRKFPICTKFSIQSSQNQGRRTYNSTFWWQQLNFCINFGSFRWPIQLKSIHREEQEQNKKNKNSWNKEANCLCEFRQMVFSLWWNISGCRFRLYIWNRTENLAFITTTTYSYNLKNKTTNSYCSAMFVGAIADVN